MQALWRSVPPNEQLNVQDTERKKKATESEIPRQKSVVHFSDELE